MDSRQSLATEHLILRLQPLNRALRAAVENQRVLESRLARPDLHALCVTDEQVNLLLEQIDVTQSGSALSGLPMQLSAEEEATEGELRERSTRVGVALPLDRLEHELRLTPFEQEAILICAAPELDRTYERIYAFILDDLNRRFPCVDLLISLTAASIEDRIERRHAITSSSKLRRYGILRTTGEAPTELRQELRLGPGFFAFLSGAGGEMAALYRDHDEVVVPRDITPPAQISAEQLAHLRDALADRTISILGVWGPTQNDGEELVFALAAMLKMPLRRIGSRDDRGAVELMHLVASQLEAAAELGAAVWLDTDSLTEVNRPRLVSMLAETFAHAAVPVFLTGAQPCRPKALLRSGHYAECELSTDPSPERLRVWSEAFPELPPGDLNRLASRYTLSRGDIRLISNLSRTQARLAGNGHPAPVGDHVAAACALVAHSSGTQFGLMIQPKRGPDDLILSPALYRQVLEVAKFHDLRGRVDDEWGFAHLSGTCGTKALFTGEPGTGKTLSAEVIAGLLRLPLLKIDLARVVSKWVGETEKNLEAAFREAEEAHSVLFFDEAEALFGKRGEVQHGTDRYANLEVSYLLQRLEISRGLVILASNVKDQIDPAFIRRFQIVVHFSKPGINERRRIWERALPANAPLAEGVDIQALARLEMTGAGIVSSARTAAFLAAEAGAETIDMTHLIRATARQFQREARVLTPAELGAYGALLQEAP